MNGFKRNTSNEIGILIFLAFFMFGCGTDGKVSLDIIPSQAVKTGETIILKASGDFPSNSIKWTVDGVTNEDCSGNKSCEFSSTTATTKEVKISVGANVGSDSFEQLGESIQPHSGDSEIVTLIWGDDTNNAPTDISLSATSIAEGQSAGTTVATLSTTDADSDDIHTYALVEGTGDSNNSSFTISDSSLQTAETFDFETQNSYSIRIQTSDSSGTTYEEAFTITISDDGSSPSVITTASASAASYSSDLTIPNLTTSVSLSWTSVGDDGDIGTATSYDIRYSTSSITSTSTCDAATSFSNSITPSASGNSESISVTGLTWATSYHFCIRAVDASGNKGDWTSTLSATTDVNLALGLVDAGFGHTCARLSDGSVKCWGSNDKGQIGDGTTGTDRSSPTTAGSLTNALAVEVGESNASNQGFSCALLSDGTVQCWGDNTGKQVGESASNPTTSPTSISSSLSSVTQLAAGGNFTSVGNGCALISDGSIKCWGDDSSGNLGDGAGDSGDQSTPVSASGISTAVRVSTGGIASCAVLSDGTAQCWGNGANGTLGDGATSNNETPNTVSNLTTVREVSVGAFQGSACALLSDSTIQCWGLGSNGQMGNGTSSGSAITTPQAAVTGITTAKQIAVGGAHVCALLSGGTIQCWGVGTQGQMGDGNNNGTNNTPVTVSGISNAVYVASGTRHSCAVLSDGTVKCWGLNDKGQLGDGTTTNSNTPVTVVGLDLF